MQKRDAFTLIELLFVIAIIGILATMTVPKIGHALEDAKEQQCRTNLKNLQAAVVSFAADHEIEGRRGCLPRAQSFETYNGASDVYEERPAWVSWIPIGAESEVARERSLSQFWSDEKQKKQSHSPQLCDDCGTGRMAKFAVEHGGLYDYVGDLRAYVCPVIEREVKKRVANYDGALDFDEQDKALADADRKLKIYRTYAMNPYFGAVSTGRNWWPVLSGHVGVSQQYKDRYWSDRLGSSTASKYYPIPEPSKLMVFTEIIPAYENDKNYKRTKMDDFARGGGELSQSGCIDPERPDSKNEYICWDPQQAGTEWEFGIHSSPIKGQHSALAIFFDGHVEKVFPRVMDESGRPTDLNTAWFLNRGFAPGDTAMIPPGI
ncbi:MAG: type II secretion system protein [Kiritimatiellae bacterium]|nr:type II secretion system protein [Kiritimatiellia bacterium]